MTLCCSETSSHLIKGYMLRHKVKPGITGCAQVNGRRGETETLDKMRARVQYDIVTIRNGSHRRRPDDRWQDPRRRLARPERVLMMFPQVMTAIRTRSG